MILYYQRDTSEGKKEDLKMIRFEVSKLYGEKAVKYLITARTSKTVTFVEVQHAGRENERHSEPKKAKLQEWGASEAFYTKHGDTVIA